MCDYQLYTAVGDVARTKLNDTVIKEISDHARSQFGHGGSIYKGLFKVVNDYRYDLTFTGFTFVTSVHSYTWSEPL